MRLAAAAAALMAVGLAGCGDTETADEPASSARPTVLDPVLQRVVELAEDSEPVEFTASDGVRLTGRVFGSGSTTVVLSHMGATGSSQEDWFPLAARLAEEGYRVLTYNRRAVCSVALDECSEGAGRLDQHHLDVAGAAAFARESGADHVVLGGASLGAMATLHAAVTGLAEPEGLIWVAGVLRGEYEFDRGVVRRLGSLPVLLVSSREDSYDAGPDARRLNRWIGDRAELLVVPGRDHGTHLLDADAPPDISARVTGEMLDFLAGLPPAGR